MEWASGGGYGGSREDQRWGQSSQFVHDRESFQLEIQCIYALKNKTGMHVWAKSMITVHSAGPPTV